MIEGYVWCRNCNNWVVREVARRTGGLCGDCIDDLQATIGRIEVQIGGKLVKILTHRKHYGSKGDPTVAKEAAKARDRARRRLTRLFPAMFEMLVADERARAGIEPWPIEAMTQPMDPDELDLELRALWETWMKPDSYPSGDGNSVQAPRDASE